MSDERRSHWEAVFRGKQPGEVSWYQPQLQVSLRLIDGLGLPKSARVIDIGGGASTLVDDLLARGYTEPSVLDIAAAALERSRERLGERAASVRWIAADITEVELPEQSVELWHDRAVFHFLVDADARARYLAQVRRALVVGGHVVIGTFGPTGPERCSGLAIVRYDPQALVGEFGSDFELLEAVEEAHHTPQGRRQDFVYCVLRFTD